MLHVANMKKAANDNTDTWIQLAVATANLVRYLEHPKEQEPDRERKAPENDNERDKSADHKKAVEHGLRQIERFESRYRRSDRS